MSRNILILIVAMCVCAAAVTISLVVTGRLDQGLEVGRWAGGGIMTFGVCVWLFGSSNQ